MLLAFSQTLLRDRILGQCRVMRNKPPHCLKTASYHNEAEDISGNTLNMPCAYSQHDVTDSILSATLSRLREYTP